MAVAKVVVVVVSGEAATADQHDRTHAMRHQPDAAPDCLADTRSQATAVRYHATMSHTSGPSPGQTTDRPAMPYRIAVLCYLFDEAGRTLLLHRVKPPNEELYSPIGGKLEQAIGESPTDCAVREIREEAGLTLTPADLHLTGIVSEAAFLGQMHWLMFLYEVTRPVVVEASTFDEGRLEWHDPTTIAGLPLPETDRQVIWPMFWHYRGRFFAAHIDGTGPEMTWSIQQPGEDATVPALGPFTP